ncbi:hypothetical protein KJ758_00320 [Patescibacteria group bacterium]|nr:hypothetical protein [Patescibacteria group bacterium]
MTKKQKSILSIGATVIIVAIVVFLVLNIIYFGAKEANLARTFVDRLADAEYDEAYSLTSAAFKENTSLQALQEFVEYYAVVDNSERVKFNYRNSENGIYTLSGWLYSSEDRKPMTIEMLEEAGEWKISFFSVDPIDLPSKPAFNE